MDRQAEIESYADISIHALREEGDQLRAIMVATSCIFLSTPSARRATAFLQKNSAALTDFYPRPPRGGRPVSVTRFLILPSISIHALREEGDLSAGCAAFALSNFYPRPPRGGRPGRAAYLTRRG